MSVEEPRNDLEAIASDQDFQVALNPTHLHVEYQPLV